MTQFVISTWDDMEQHLLARILSCSHLPFETRIDATFRVWWYLDMLRTAKGLFQSPDVV